MKLIIDTSSLLWSSLLAGSDVEAKTVNHNGADIKVNTAEYGYENAVNSLVKSLADWKLTPKDCIFAVEGRDSKKRRSFIDPGYKAKRGNRPPEAYVEFNRLKAKLVETFRNLGAIVCTQDFVEADDVIAWLVENTEEDCVVVSRDNDLIVLNGVNRFGAKCFVSINGEVGKNTYGDFDFKLVTLYKCTVGDTSDSVPGCRGFGPAAFLNLLARYQEDGLFELMDLVRTGKLNELAVLAKDNQCKILQKIVDNWAEVVKSYKLVLLHPEWVNTIRQQLEWAPGMVKAGCEDERLRQWQGQSRLVTAENYGKAVEFLKSKLGETPFFTIDFETSVPEESDDWLEQRGKNGVDVIGSTIVSMGLSFGANLQYSYYISVDHSDTNNVTLDQLGSVLEMLPRDKFVVAHNAAGFELPVAYNAFAERFKNNGWRGFIPNMVDTRIAASFWDENQPSHGLKQLSKLLLNYEQGTYAETTTKSGVVGILSGGRVSKSYEVDGVRWEDRQYKMHQLTAKEVVGYGVDDVYTAGALWNFFKLFMQLDHTYEAFCRLEQKPMYLSALAYVQGVDVDMPRLAKLSAEDKELSDKCWKIIEEFLIEKGWDGVTCPVFEELTPANIKQAVQIVLGQELKSMVRTPAKLAVLIEQLDHEDAGTLAALIADNKVDLVNRMVASRYTGKPDFNVGSPKQISKLLYEVIGMPIRLRNKATDSMRAAGIKEGNPRTDDGAIDMAIKFGDVSGREAEVLEALLEMKSCNTRNALYWSAIPVHIHWKTGKLHSEITQSNTNTRRWTSSKINLQQLESNPEGVRSVILDRDRLVTSLDQSSQEVRLMAELSQDEGLLSCYVGNNLRDTHSLVAHRIAGVTYEEFMDMRMSEDKTISSSASAIRRIAKAVFFGYLYGSAAPKTAETLGITEEQAQTYIDAINSAFPGIKRYQEESSSLAETLGYVPLLGGTKRHLAKLVTSEDKWEASKALRQAGNSRIQGAAANQIKTVMTKVWDSHLLDDTSFKWLFCVHDEIVVSTDAHDTVDVIHEVHKIMTEPFLKSLPSESSLGVGKSFGALLEQPENEFSGGRFNKEMLQKAIDSLVT
jgi:5'-3' exonuclease